MWCSLSSFFLLTLSVLYCDLVHCVDEQPTIIDNEEILDDIVGSALDPHPDPNDENYEGMIYIGRHEDDGTRMGFEKNNG